MIELESRFLLYISKSVTHAKRLFILGILFALVTFVSIIYYLDNTKAPSIILIIFGFFSLFNVTLILINYFVLTNFKYLVSFLFREETNVKTQIKFNNNYLERIINLENKIANGLDRLIKLEENIKNNLNKSVIELVPNIHALELETVYKLHLDKGFLFVYFNSIDKITKEFNYTSIDPRTGAISFNVNGKFTKGIKLEKVPNKTIEEMIKNN